MECGVWSVVYGVVYGVVQDECVELGSDVERSGIGLCVERSNGAGWDGVG